MNPRKFSFIICSNSTIHLNECENYLAFLNMPPGYEADIIVINDAASMLSGMNEGCNATDAKYKIYMHQDVFIINPDFLINILKIFESDEKIGLIGMIGCKSLPADFIMWNTDQVGNIYNKSTATGLIHYAFDASTDVLDVLCVDGLMMITAYDIKPNFDLFDGWDFYDVSTSLEYHRNGYRVVVPNQSFPWCIHDDGAILSLWNYDKYRKIALNEYKEYINVEPM